MVSIGCIALLCAGFDTTLIKLWGSDLVGAVALSQLEGMQ
jgi:hypothetical protein